MTGFAATHTGSLTPSSDPWTFVGTVTWQSDNDPQNYAFNGTYIKGFEYGGAYSAGRMAGLAAFNYALTAGQIAAQYAAAL